MRCTSGRAIVLSVMNASTNFVKVSVGLPFFSDVTAETTTWAEIVRVLEESQESERRAWFSAGNDGHNFSLPRT